MGQAFLYPQNVFFYAMNDHRWWREARLKRIAVQYNKFNFKSNFKILTPKFVLQYSATCSI